MAAIGFRCCRDGTVISLEQSLECGASGKSPNGLDCKYSFEQINGMQQGSDRSSAHISVTNLSGCRRRSRLQMENDYVIDGFQAYSAFRGSLAHQLMEDLGDPSCLYERRFEIIFPGYETPFTGQIDKVDINRRIIQDFKTKKDRAIPKTADADHIYQLNCYRYLVKHGYPQRGFMHTAPNGISKRYPKGTPAGIEIDTLKLTYFSMEKTITLEAEIIDENEIRDYILDGMLEITAKALPSVPDDLDPLGSSKLCTDYCPMHQACVDNLLKKRVA